MSDFVLILIVLAIAAGFVLWRVLKPRGDDAGTTGRADGGRHEPRDRTRER